LHLLLFPHLLQFLEQLFRRLWLLLLRLILRLILRLLLRPRHRLHRRVLRIADVYLLIRIFFFIAAFAIIVRTRLRLCPSDGAGLRLGRHDHTLHNVRIILSANGNKVEF